MRLIDADVLTGEVDKSKYNNPHDPGIVRVNHRNEHDHFMRMIYDAPTVDAVEVVHGRWISDGLGDGERICSVCKRYAIYTHRSRYDQYLTAYCPKCGAKMSFKEEQV